MAGGRIELDRGDLGIYGDAAAEGRTIP